MGLLVGISTFPSNSRLFVAMVRVNFTSAGLRILALIVSENTPLCLTANRMESTFSSVYQYCRVSRSG